MLQTVSCNHHHTMSRQDDDAGPGSGRPLGQAIMPGICLFFSCHGEEWCFCSNKTNCMEIAADGKSSVCLFVCFWAYSFCTLFASFSCIIESHLLSLFHHEKGWNED